MAVAASDHFRPHVTTFFARSPFGAKHGTGVIVGPARPTVATMPRSAAKVAGRNDPMDVRQEACL